VSRRRGKGDSQADGGSSYTTTGGVGWLDEGLDEYDADYPLDEGLEEALVSSKLDAIHTEYSALLTSQLDSQRRYFEGLMAANTAERDGALSAAEAAESRAKVIAGAVDDARDARAKLQEAHKKIDESLAKNAKLEEERDFLKQLNDTLLENQRQLRASLDAAEDKSRDSRDAKDAKIVDLEEQVRDLMVFLDAQTRLGEETGTGGDVIDGGDVVGVGDGEEPPSRDAAHARLQGKLRARRKSGR
jgi:BRCA1-associated protein